MFDLFVIEPAVKKAILSCLPYNWDEDFISRTLLNELRNNLDGKKIDGFNSESVLRINTFKANGKLENTFGDIAFLVKIKFKDNDAIEGVGFLEAKKKYIGTNTFDALKFNQLTRIKNNAPHAMLLLYDFSVIRSYFPYIFQLDSAVRFSRTNAVVCQIDPAINLNRNDIGLYKICYPLSYQLAHRYFRGLDLEYSPEILAQAKGYASEMGFPKYVITITISSMEEEPERPDLNRDLFSEFFE